MKTKILLFTIGLLLSSIVSLAQYSWQWALSEGGMFNEYISSICIDNNGNIYAAGSFQESFDFFGITLTSSGREDAFVASFDTEGNLNWVKEGGGPYEDSPRDICTDGQYIYVTGGFVDEATFGDQTLLSTGAMDMYLLKYDLDGNLQWAVSGGSVTDDAGISITTDETGNIYMVGNINNVATFGDKTVEYYGFSDVFIAKYDSNGGCVWANSAGGPIYDSGSSIAEKNGHLFIGGGFNDVAVFGDTTLTSVDFVDIYVAHYLADGTFVEAASAGGTNNELLECLAVDSDMNVYIGGWFMFDITIGGNTLNSNGISDIFLAKYKPGLGFSWAQAYGGIGSDDAFRMLCNEDDRIVVAGTFENEITIGTTQLTSDGYRDGFVGSFDANGSFDWVYQIGGSGSTTIRGCATDSDGNYYFAGDFLEELIIGNFVFYPVANYDMFIAQLGEGGSYLSETNAQNPIKVKNFPNPFAANTVFEFELNKPEIVIVTFYNKLGKQVDMIELYQPKGINKILWSPIDLPAGTYYYKLTANNRQSTGKVLLLK